MTQSRLTINVNCSYVHDWNRTREFLRKLNPHTVVAVIDNMRNRNRILEIKQDLPNTHVIARCIIVVKNPDGSDKQLDGSMHTKPQDDRYWLVSPGDFLGTYGELGQGGLSLSYMNEPQTSDASNEDVQRQIQHMIETIGLATNLKISLVVGNWGVGQAPYDARFDGVFEIVSKQRELHSLGYHLYSPVDTFHAIEHVIARAKAKGFAPPRMQITEFGFDTGGQGDPLNGYKSRGYSGVQFAGWCVDKVNNVYSTYIQNSSLESVAVFGWGYAASFPAFDVESDVDWQSTVLDAANKGLLSVATKPLPPTYTIPPIVPNSKYVVHVPSEYINVRKAPIVTTTAPLATLKTGDVVIALEEMVSGGEFWVHVNNDKDGEITDGWISMQQGAVRLVAYVPPVIPLPPPTNPPLPNPPYPEVNAAYAREMAQVYANLAVAHRLMASDSELTSKQWLKLADVIEGKQAA